MDYARNACRAAPATIELYVDGMYMVVHQDEGWRRPPFGRETPARGNPIAVSYSDAASVVRARSSTFIEWRAAAMRLIASLVSGLASMKRSKSALRRTSSLQ
jgi:hypothetical protein